jgi:MFS family permease
VARMTRKAATRPAVLSLSGLLVALSVEFVDELVDGTKGAALPLIRADLGLSYSQIGLLAAVPLLVGGLLELPFGLLAGDGSRRWRVVLGGGAVFTASLLAAAAAPSFITLLIAFVIFFPASGAFVSLTQATLMDADPVRRAQHMARWNLAGSAGSVAGPLLLVAVAAAGGPPTCCWPARRPLPAWGWRASGRCQPGRRDPQKKSKDRRNGISRSVRPPRSNPLRKLKTPTFVRRSVPWGAAMSGAGWSCLKSPTCCWTC